MELEGNPPGAKQPQELRQRGISTLKQWCEVNGYDGVTKECIQSAMNQDNPELNALAKQHLLRGVAENE
tara:strand:+ start:93 stop:299 length:207 start_codon:yes stop_codon:yes gene_type:complete